MRFIKNNIKFLIAMLIVIVLGVFGITYALKIATFNPIGINTTTGTINANVTYDSTNTSTVTSTGNMLPIADNLVTGVDVTDSRILKIKFMVSGVSSNPSNTIYDIALRDISMSSALKSKYVKWRLYKNGTLLSEGNFSPSFDTIENNRLVLTNTQQDLTTSTDTYVYLMWISEACTDENITTCDSQKHQNKYSNKIFNASIKIEASTKSKKELVRTKAVIGDVNEDGKENAIDALWIQQYLANTRSLTKQQLFNADVNGDGIVNTTDQLLIKRFSVSMYQNTLPNEPITDYVFYGDVNEDDKINTIDASLLYNYISGSQMLSYQQLRNADINGDGKVNYLDRTIISGYIRGYISGQLPNYPITDYVLYGDVNEDGEITEEDAILLSTHLNNNAKISDQALKNSDVNGDGKVNVIDLGLLQMYIANPDNYKNSSGSLLPYNKIDKSYYTINYGDINCDGSIDVYDIQYLYEYLSGSSTLTGQELLNADVNGDGVINSADQSALSKLL